MKIRVPMLYNKEGFMINAYHEYKHGKYSESDQKGTAMDIFDFDEFFTAWIIVEIPEIKEIEIEGKIE